MPFESLAGRAVYRAAHWATFYTFTFGWSFRAAGRANIPPSGPVLLVANHQSFIDPVLVGLGATRALTYARHRSDCCARVPLGCRTPSALDDPRFA